ncbi:MAG: hypothetical protein ABWZ57_10250 [Mesorhizobium sp.]
MQIWNHIAFGLNEVREFVVPSYHPERHYMRGPGPACARRSELLLAQAPAFAGAARMRGR